MKEPRGKNISEEAAFELLIAKCLSQEKYPQHVGRMGYATGWYNQMRMHADQYGWKLEIKITDKE